MKIVRRENESTEDLLRRFKTWYKKSGIKEECRKREYFLKKSLRLKEKSKQARIRNKKKSRAN